jgi:stearoyl-CoA desaturase (Delta-9 desaturase)
MLPLSGAFSARDHIKDRINDMTPTTQTDDGDIVYPGTIRFMLVHLVCFAAIWTGVTWTAMIIGIAFYWLRMFFIGAGYHRYFSHRAYKTGRIFQFVLAFMAQTTTQKSVIWWAAKHRHHHRHSDTEDDVHSPVRRSFLYSHVGWIFDRKHGSDAFDWDSVQDLTKDPELMFLHRFEQTPSVVAALVCYALGGWSGLVVGFFWSTVAVYHGTFAINSLAHVHGSKRYLTGDESRNNPLLAFVTMGEGWHNNHHAYQYAARQGFRWWELDPTYYVLSGLEKLGLVWDLKLPPPAVLANRHLLPPRVIERSAERLAAAFSVEAILKAVNEVYAGAPSLDDLRNRIHEAQEAFAAQAAERFANMHMPQVHWPHLPEMPSLEDMRRRAAEMFVATPALDQVAARAHQLVMEAVWGRLGAVR